MERTSQGNHKNISLQVARLATLHNSFSKRKLLLMNHRSYSIDRPTSNKRPPRMHKWNVEYNFFTRLQSLNSLSDSLSECWNLPRSLN